MDSHPLVYSISKPINTQKALKKNLLPYREEECIRGMPVQNGTIVQVGIDNQRFMRTIFVRKGVQKRTIMYKKEQIIEVEYEEVASKPLGNSFFSHRLPNMSVQLRRELSKIKINPVARQIGQAFAVVTVKAIVLIGQVLFFVTTILWTAIWDTIVALKNAIWDSLSGENETQSRTQYETKYRTEYGTSSKTQDKTLPQTDWRDIPTGQNRSVRRRSDKKGQVNIYNIHIHNH